MARTTASRPSCRCRPRHRCAPRWRSRHRPDRRRRRTGCRRRRADRRRCRHRSRSFRSWRPPGQCTSRPGRCRWPRPASRLGRSRSRRPTGHAGPVASGAAADALGADCALALGAARTDGAVRLEPAGTRDAGGRHRAVAVGRAGRPAGVRPAGEREAGRRRGDPAGAGAVAGSPRGEGRSRRRAGCVLAGGPLLVLLAGAGPAFSVGATARRALVHAAAGRIGARGDGGALSHRSGDGARPAGARAGGGAADALRAKRRLALDIVRAKGADRFEATGVGRADVHRRARAAVGATGKAASAIADERRAGERVRNVAFSGGIAGRGRGVDAGAAALGRAGGAGRVLVAATRAVAGAVSSTGGGVLIGADAVGVSGGGGARSAGAERGRQRAAPTGAGAGGVAADAVDAKVGGALIPRRAGLSHRLGAAAPVDAAVAAHAVVVRDAVIDASAARALIGPAFLDPLGPAASEPVAGAGRVLSVAAAGGGEADGLGRVLGAAADAVAAPRLAAGRLGRLRTDLVRIGRVQRRRLAGPDAAVLIAADAWTGAAAVAADAVRAVPGCALPLVRAGGAARFEAAAPGHTFGVGGAIGVRGAGADAGVRLSVAVEWCADDRWAGGAGPGAVAEPDAADRRAVAGPCLADRAELVAAAPPFAITGAVEGTGRGWALRADAGYARCDAGRHERTDARRGGGVAGLAALGAGAVAADAVDAEATRAVGVAAAGGAVGLARAAVAARLAVGAAVHLAAAPPVAAVATGDPQRERGRHGHQDEA